MRDRNRNRNLKVFDLLNDLTADEKEALLTLELSADETSRLLDTANTVFVKHNPNSPPPTHEQLVNLAWEAIIGKETTNIVSTHEMN